MNITAFVTDSKKLTYVLGGSIALLVFFAFLFVLTNSLGSRNTTNAELTVWGVYDDSGAFQEAISNFKKDNKGINITYRMLKPQEYEQALLNALAAGTGPDIWMMHHTWLPKHSDKLTPMPATAPGQKVPLMTLRQYQDLFVDVASDDLVIGDKIYGMPLYVDTLALYYNKDIFASAGVVQPPATWAQFIDDVKKITTYDESRNITRSAVALGTARTINRSTDILMMLMLQSGVRMTDTDHTQAVFSRSVNGTPVGENSLQFYTDFSNPQRTSYTWNDSMNYSFDAFVSGATAMMINYQHQTSALKAAAPRLRWAIAPVPQASTSDIRTYANYWAMVVSSKSKSPDAAWQFVHYLTAGNGTASYLSATGRPAARKDIIEQQTSDPQLGVFAQQALAARSWYQIDAAAIETIFAEMIDSVTFGKQTISQALKAAEARVSVLMSK